MKKLLVVTSAFPRWKEQGLDNFMLEYAEAMSEHFEVIVLAPYTGGSKRSETWDKLTIYRHKQFPLLNIEMAYGSGIVSNIKKNPLLTLVVPFYFIMQAIWIFKISRRHGVDYINAHWAVPQGTSARLYQLLFNRRAKIIGTVHGSDFWSLNKWPLSSLRSFSLRKAKLVCAVSKALETAIMKEYPKLNVINLPLGINTDLFSPAPQLEKQERFNVLYIGNLIPEKGVFELLNAMNKVVEVHENAKLTIVGDGQAKQKLIDLGKSLNIEKNIEFKGIIPNNQLAEYYRQADVFCLPSYSEGFPVVIKEALSSGTICLVSDLPAFSEYPELKDIIFTTPAGDEDSLARNLLYILDHLSSFGEKRKNGRSFILKTADWKTISQTFSNEILKLEQR